MLSGSLGPLHCARAGRPQAAPADVDTVPHALRCGSKPSSVRYTNIAHQLVVSEAGTCILLLFKLIAKSRLYIGIPRLAERLSDNWICGTLTVLKFINCFP